MSEMIERVARAICRANRRTSGFKYGDHYTLDHEVENAWDLFIPEAKAALQTLLDPTEAMLAPIRAHYARSFPDGSELVEGWVQTAIENHHLMIDTALDEKEGGQ